METYDRIREIIDANITYCLVPLLITIILIEVIFKGKFRTAKVLNLVRWFIIYYTIATTVVYILGMLLFPAEYAFTNRATGPYKVAYWTMLIGATVFPMTLLYKKLGSKSLYLLLVAFLMKIGWYFESFVIIITSYHRDYSPNGPVSDWFSFPIGVLMICLQGFILAVVLLGIFELIDRKNSRQETRSVM